MSCFMKAAPWVVAACFAAGCGTVTVTVSPDGPSFGSDNAQSPVPPDPSPPGAQPSPSTSQETTPTPSPVSSDAAFFEVPSNVPGIATAAVLQVGPGNPKLVACVAIQPTAGQGFSVELGMEAATVDPSRSEAQPYAGDLIENGMQDLLGGKADIKCLGREVNYGPAAAAVNLYVVGFTTPGMGGVPPHHLVAVPGTPAVNVAGATVADRHTQSSCDELNKWAGLAAGRSITITIPPCVVQTPTQTSPNLTVSAMTRHPSVDSYRARQHPIRL